MGYECHYPFHLYKLYKTVFGCFCMSALYNPEQCASWEWSYHHVITSNVDILLYLLKCLLELLNKIHPHVETIMPCLFDATVLELHNCANYFDVLPTPMGL